MANQFAIALFTITIAVGLQYIDDPLLSYDEAQAYCRDNFYLSNLATIANPQDIMEANEVIDDSTVEVWMGLFSDEPNGWWLFQNFPDVCPEPENGACVNIWGKTNRGMNAPLCINEAPCVDFFASANQGFRCGYYLADDEEVYNDLDCNEPKPFICEDPTDIDTDITLPEDITIAIPFEFNIDGSANNAVGLCACPITISNPTCSNDHKQITITCMDNDVVFENFEPLVSCIDIPEEVIPSGVTVEKVIISTEFQHTDLGDVNVASLIKGNKQSLLWFPNSCEGQTDANVTFSDDADAPFNPSQDCLFSGPNDCPNPFSIQGTFQPEDPLSMFIGQQANGIWVYAMQDGTPGDDGTMVSWSLTLELSEACGPVYVPKDADGDGIDDRFCDNCLNMANSDQLNFDMDRFGNACDNCLLISNEDQSDVDHDGLGDACDGDNDNDYIPEFDDDGNRIDNCPSVANTCQADKDGDGIGDACDKCPYKPGKRENWGCPEYKGNKKGGRRKYGSHSHSSSSYSSSRDSEDSYLLRYHRRDYASQNDENIIESGLDFEDDGMEHRNIKINLSTNTILNIWCMVVLFIIINIIIYIYYNKTNNCKNTVQKSYLPSIREE